MPASASRWAAAAARELAPPLAVTRGDAVQISARRNEGSAALERFRAEQDAAREVRASANQEHDKQLMEQLEAGRSASNPWVSVSTMVRASPRLRRIGRVHDARHDRPPSRRWTSLPRPQAAETRR